MRVSRARITSNIFFLLLLPAAAPLVSALQAQPGADQSVRQPRAASSAAADPAQIFERGRAALAAGNLVEAERDFRQVLQLDPQSGDAYTNLGVVYMRGKQWSKAVSALQHAERLKPQAPGIRLNIGLAYYRQNEFLKAIPAFESVLRQQPDAAQARYLLGLCYFFADRWADAATTLEPLWPQESGEFAYLYVLSNAAHRAGRTDLDDRATRQLLKVGNNSLEYHLFAGKYHLNRQEYDQAIAQFEASARANPRLPFVHFNLGLAYLGKQDYSRARDEFLKDAEIEPDLALNYEQLGDIYWQTQDDNNAEKSYQEALRRDPRLASSRLGLARIYQRQKKFAAALAQADAALKADPARTDAHYIRGQVLLHLGRKQEAKKELAAAGGTGGQPPARLPSPELLQDSQ
ncbi:MAG TPA: tetratricopeptide repeat protein [Candidatus Sulfotelmatobacter sp.]|nr:tetratricopeptide repeat protein [Candidatus Sulfotelmatobacter sp.]